MEPKLWKKTKGKQDRTKGTMENCYLKKDRPHVSGTPEFPDRRSLRQDVSVSQLAIAVARPMLAVYSLHVSWFWEGLKSGIL